MNKWWPKTRAKANNCWTKSKLEKWFAEQIAEQIAFCWTKEQKWWPTEQIGEQTPDLLHKKWVCWTKYSGFVAAFARNRVSWTKPGATCPDSQPHFNVSDTTPGIVQGLPPPTHTHTHTHTVDLGPGGPWTRPVDLGLLSTASPGFAFTTLQHKRNNCVPHAGNADEMLSNIGFPTPPREDRQQKRWFRTGNEQTQHLGLGRWTLDSSWPHEPLFSC